MIGPGVISSARRRTASLIADFGALVRKSTNDQTFGTTAGSLAFDTEVYDAGGWHAAGNANMTVPAAISLVRVTSNLRETGTTNQKIQHRLGGATFRGMGLADALVLNNIVSAPIAVSPGDSFEMWYNRESVGSSTPTNDEETWFAIEKMDPTTKYAIVHNSASISLPTPNTDTFLSFDTEDADTSSWHSTVTNPSRMTVPSGVTLVRLTANLSGGSVTGQITAHFRKNGAFAYGLPLIDTDTTGDDNINLVSAPIVVTTGDYFELVAQTETATSIPSANNVWFAIEEVPSTYKRALVRRTATQSFSAGVTATLAWDAEEYDTDSMHDTVTNNSRLTVPSGCTKARPTFAVRLTNTTGVKTAWVTKNGSDYFGMPGCDSDTLSTDQINGIGAWVDVTPGDYFELKFLSSIACATEVAGVPQGTWFSLECQ